MLNVIYRRPTSLKPNDLELCETCSGFGRVRCQVCMASGEITNYRANVIEQCPLCCGRKYERCRRCAGRGTTGVKASESSLYK